MTTTRAALVNAIGLVESVAIIDLTSSWEPPEGLTAHQLDEGSQVAPGWTLTGETFTPPAAEPAGPELPSILDLQAQLDDLADFIATNL